MYMNSKRSLSLLVHSDSLRIGFFLSSRLLTLLVVPGKAHLIACSSLVRNAAAETMPAPKKVSCRERCISGAFPY